MVAVRGERAHAHVLESSGYQWDPDGRRWHNHIVDRAISEEAVAARSTEEVCRWIETGHFRRTHW